MGNGLDRIDLVETEVAPRPLVTGNELRSLRAGAPSDADDARLLQELRDRIGEMASRGRNIRWDLCTAPAPRRASAGDDPEPM
jgi:hypothetical protein